MWEGSLADPGKSNLEKFSLDPAFFPSEAAKQGKPRTAPEVSSLPLKGRAPWGAVAGEGLSQLPGPPAGLGELGEAWPEVGQHSTLAGG